ncbi:MAG: hypothetical protein ACE5FO_12190 [Parvularculaceae bacterium]
MTGLDYAARNLAGAWRMAWDMSGWEETLDRSVDGVFRSFWALAAAAPFSVLSFASLRRAADRISDFPEPPLLEAPFLLIMAAELVGLFVDWGISLFALVMIARALSAHKNVAALIVGYNWSQIYAIAVLTAPVTAMGLTASTSLAAALYMPAVAFAIAILAGVLRRALPLNIGMTIATIVLLTLVGVIVNSAINGFALFVYQAFS